MNHFKDKLYEEGNYLISVFRWEKSTLSKFIEGPWKEGIVELEDDKTINMIFLTAEEEGATPADNSTISAEQAQV